MVARKKTSPKTRRTNKTPPAEESSLNEGSDPVSRIICERVKELRRKKNWTLEQLASLSGVSRSMLSQIERGAANPTLVVGWRIAAAFGMSLGDLVDLPPQTSQMDVVRRSDRGAIFRDDSQCRIRTLSPLQCEKDVEFYHLTLKAHGILESAPHFEGTREFLTIESGTAHVISGDLSEVLAAGDSAHYPADVPHKIANSTAAETEAFLVVIYVPTQQRLPRRDEKSGSPYSGTGGR
jgi:transcriptional regulator with XRE-family HTH domain